MIVVQRGMRANWGVPRFTSLVHIERQSVGEDSRTVCGRLMYARTWHGDLMSEEMDDLSEVTCLTCRERAERVQ